LSNASCRNNNIPTFGCGSNSGSQHEDGRLQENGYDCGILALMNAESFVKIIEDGKNFDKENIPCGNAAAYRELMIRFYNAHTDVQKADDKK
jgi:hypothetical protein